MSVTTSNYLLINFLLFTSTAPLLSFLRKYICSLVQWWNSWVTGYLQDHSIGKMLLKDSLTFLELTGHLYIPRTGSRNYGRGLCFHSLAQQQMAFSCELFYFAYSLLVTGSGKSKLSLLFVTLGASFRLNLIKRMWDSCHGQARQLLDLI